MGHKRKTIIIIIITKALEYSKQVSNAHRSPVNAQPAPELWPLTSLLLVYMIRMALCAMEYHFGVRYSGCVPS